MAQVVSRKRRASVFVGRGQVMRDVKEVASGIVAAFCDGDQEKSVRFTTFEGSSGIGKTRCLQEVREQVRLYLTPRDQRLKELYEAGAVFQIFLTFNGRGSDHSHMPPLDISMSGSKFLEVSILSEVLHGSSYFMLDVEKRDSVARFSSFAEAMGEVSHFLKQGRSGAIALFVLLDEMQLLAAHLGFREGKQFIKEMCDAMGRFMRDACSRDTRDLILLPCLAGCRVPDVGTFGASSWSKQVHVLPGLSVADSKEVVRAGIENPNASLLGHAHLALLLENCLGVPRFLEWFSAGLRKYEREDTEDKMKIQLARDSMIKDMECWAVSVVDFGGSNVEQLKDAFRYCLVRASVEDAELAARESIRGYLCWKEVAGRVVFEAPIFLLNLLGRTLDLHLPLVNLQPSLVQSAELERACLEMVYVRLCLARGRTLELNQLLPGCTWESHVLVRVPPVVAREDEAQQFLRGNPRHFTRSNDSTTRLVRAGGGAGVVELLPVFGKVLMTPQPCPVADGRLFLQAGDCNAPNQVVELWFQCKGDQQLSMPQLRRWCDDAFARELELPGRSRVYVIFTPYCAFDAASLDSFYEELQGLGRNVLVMDSSSCEVFMPAFFARCTN